MYASVAQSVEQKTENLRVGGSIPPQGTNIYLNVVALLYRKFSNNVYMLVWLNGRAADL